jgi:hypothetical protein
MFLKGGWVRETKTVKEGEHNQRVFRACMEISQ